MLQLPKIQLSKKKSDDSLVGLEIEAGSVAAAEVRVNGAVSVVGAAVAPLPPEAFHDGEVRDPGSVAEALRALFSANKLSRRVRLGIANQRVVVRTLRLPAIEDPAELETAIRFSAQEQIAMPLDQAVLDYRVVGGAPGADGSSPQIDVIVVAARRDMIAASLQPLRDAGLEPVGVDLSAFGMIRALADQDGVAEEPAESEPDAPAAVLYCNVGDVTNLAVAKGRSCLFTRVSAAGLDDMANGFSSAVGLSQEHARMWLQHVGLSQPAEQLEGDANVVAKARAALETGASALLDELRLSLDFYGAQEAAVPVERILLCGPGGAIPGLVERMQPELNIPIAAAHPAALSGYDAVSAARLTLPFGLALDL
jgi:type IV pilus assembly protein PilM